MSIFFPPPPPFVGGAQPNAGHNGNVPSEAVPVNAPPPSHPGRTVAIIVAAALAWQPAPPDAFEGGNQPLTARRLPAALLAVRVDTPPTGGVSAASPAFQAVLTAWQPPPAQPVLAGPLSPALQGSLAQPWPGNVALQSILTGWAPATPAPVLGRPLPPALLAVEVDSPPIGGPVWLGPPLQDILTAWQPLAPNPFLGGWQPLQPRVLPLSLIAVAVNNPPGVIAQPNAANWLTSPSVVPASSTIASLIFVAPGQVPYAPLPLAVLLAWQPAPPLPTLPRSLPASLLGVPVNNPPGLNAQPNIANWLIPAPVAPPAALVAATYRAAGQTPYAALPASVLAAWLLPDPLPTLPRKLPPVVLAVAVNNPPPLPAVSPVAAALPGWQLPPPQPVQLRPSLAWLVVTPRVPFAPLPFSILAAWVPPDPAPTQARKLPAALTAVRVDAPPRFSTTIAGSILTAWQPPPAPILVAHLSAAWLLPPLPPVPVQPPITASPSRRRTARAAVESRDVEVPAPPTRTVIASPTDRTRKG